MPHKIRAIQTKDPPRSTANGRPRTGTGQTEATDSKLNLLVSGATGSNDEACSSDVPLPLHSHDGASAAQVNSEPQDCYVSAIPTRNSFGVLSSDDHKPSSDQMSIQPHRPKPLRAQHKVSEDKTSSADLAESHRANDQNRSNSSPDSGPALSAESKRWINKLVLRMACNKCFSRNGCKEHVHEVCGGDLLCCRLQTQKGVCGIIRRTPGKDIKGHKLCRNVQWKGHCEKDSCCFSHSDEESNVWNAEKQGHFDRKEICHYLCFQQNIGQTRARPTLKPQSEPDSGFQMVARRRSRKFSSNGQKNAVENQSSPSHMQEGQKVKQNNSPITIRRSDRDAHRRLMSKVRGNFLYLCEDCFDGAPPVMSEKSKEGSFCSGEPKHKWNEVMVHVTIERGRQQYLKVRELPRHKKKPRLCNHISKPLGCWRADACGFAHNKVELQVWQCQTQDRISQQALVQLCAERFIPEPPHLLMGLSPEDALESNLHQVASYSEDRKEWNLVIGRPKIWPGIKLVLCRNGDKCRNNRCTHPHTPEEKDLWEYMAEHNLKTLDDVMAVAARFIPIQPYLCTYCNQHFPKKVQLQHHLQTVGHRVRVDTYKDGTDWKYREPPWNDDKFELCPLVEGGVCPFSGNDSCTWAHSQEELNEWNERRQYRNSQSRKVKDQKLHAFMSTYRDRNFVDEMDGITVTCSGDLNKCLRMESKLETSCFTHSWKFTLKSTNKQRLKLVGLLFPDLSENFSLHQGGERLQVCPGDSVALSEHPDEYQINVHFQSKNLGFFEQWVVFDLGTEPVLVRKIKMDLGSGDVPLADMSGIVQAESWNITNSRIVKFTDSTGQSKTPVEQVFNEKLLSTYPPPASRRIRETDLSSVKLTRENYKEVMHRVLFTEERDCNRKISGYATTSTLNVIQHVKLTDGIHYATNGHLFASINMQQAIMDDTVASHIIMLSVRMVLLKFDSSRTVYEAAILPNQAFGGESGETVLVKLSEDCVAEQQLFNGNEKQVTIQLQLDRTQFCYKHFAIDKLSNMDVVFPQTNPQQRLAPSTEMSDVHNGCQQQIIDFIIQHGGKDAPSPLPAAGPVLLCGPFGTGKTFTLSTAVKETIEKRPQSTILICTHSNSAADWYITSYLNNFDSQSPRIIRIYATYRNLDTIPLKVRPYVPKDKEGKICMPDHKMIKESQIVVTTLTTAINFISDKMRGCFSHILIDEAGQVFEAEAIIPLTMATKNTCVVLAGDHMQMSPKLFSEKVRDAGFNKSLLERLFHDKACHVFLTANYRTCQPLLDFIAKTYYRNIHLLARIDQPTVHRRFYPLTFYDVNGTDQRVGQSYVNTHEVSEVVRRVKELHDDWPNEWGLFHENVCVVSPYTMQVRQIRNNLRRENLGNVTVETVDNVQGKQYRAVIISTVRTARTLQVESSKHKDFYCGVFSDPKLLNTAFTRTQSLLVVIGDATSLCSVGTCSTKWQNYLRVCEENKSLYPLGTTLDIVHAKVRTARQGLNPHATPFQPTSRSTTQATSTGLNTYQMQDKRQMEEENAVSHELNDEDSLSETDSWCTDDEESDIEDIMLRELQQQVEEDTREYQEMQAKMSGPALRAAQEQPQSIAKVHKQGVADEHSESIAKIHEKRAADKEPESIATVRVQRAADEQPESIAKVHEQGVADEEPESIAKVHEQGVADEEPESIAKVHEQGVADEELISIAKVRSQRAADKEPESIAKVHPQEGKKGDRSSVKIKNNQKNKKSKILQSAVCIPELNDEAELQEIVMKPGGKSSRTHRKDMQNIKMVQLGTNLGLVFKDKFDRSRLVSASDAVNESLEEESEENLKMMSKELRLEGLQLLQRDPEMFKKGLFMFETSGSTYVIPRGNNSSQQVWICGKKARGQALDGDEVVIEILTNDNLEDESAKTYGKVKCILRRSTNPQNRDIVCTLDKYTDNLMVPVDYKFPKLLAFRDKRHRKKKDPDSVPVSLYKQRNLSTKFEYDRVVMVNRKERHNKLFLVKYCEWLENSRYPLCRVVKELPACDKINKLQIVQYIYGVKTKFKPSTVKYVKETFPPKWKIPEKEVQSRKDLRDKFIFTVDNPETDDLDDAMSIEMKDGQYQLGIHIADVAYFVQKGSSLDDEAKERALTFYTRAAFSEPVRMLPSRLSTDLCSLLPDQDRLAVSVFITVAEDGSVIGPVDIQQSVICSNKKLTYEEAEQMINASKCGLKDTIEQNVFQISQLAQKRRRKRLLDGCFAFSHEQEQKELLHPYASSMVEEMMLVANEEVAKFLESKYPTSIPLRCQLPPDEDGVTLWLDKHKDDIVNSLSLQAAPALKGKLPQQTGAPKDVYVLKKTVNNMLDVCNSTDETPSSMLAKVADFICTDNNHPMLAVVHAEFNHLQERAMYINAGDQEDPSRRRHHSLKKASYTSFTSPIRRYMDIVVHRLVIATLKSQLQPPYSPEEISSICHHSTNQGISAKRYEKETSRFQLALKLKEAPCSFPVFVGAVDESSLQVIYPYHRFMSSAAQRIPLQYLSPIKKPDLEDGKVRLNWKLRIYDVNSQPTERSKSVANLNTKQSVMMIPASMWQKLLNIIKQNDPSKIPSIKKILTKVTKRNAQLEDDKRYQSSSAKVEISSEGLDSKGNHFIFAECSRNFQQGDVLQVNLNATLNKGILTPSVQQLKLTPKHGICIEHRVTPTVTFNKVACKKTVRCYSVEKYKETWLPIIEMMSAHNAVHSNASFCIQGLQIIWNCILANVWSGSFHLSKSFCEDRHLKFTDSQMLKDENESDDEDTDENENLDYLCLRYDLAVPEETKAALQKHNFKQQNTDAERNDVPVSMSVIVHAAVTDITPYKDVLTVHFTACQPNLSLPSILVDSEEKFPCTVEVIPKQKPDRRLESAVRSLDKTTSLIQDIFLRKEILVATQEPTRRFEGTEVFSMITESPFGQMNDSQKVALWAALQQPFTPIQGPPGTGKTILGTVIACNFAEMNKALQHCGPVPAQVLYCGPSNESVNVVASYLRKYPELKVVRVYSETIEYEEFPIPGEQNIRLQTKAEQKNKLNSQLRSIALHHLIRKSSNTHSKKSKTFDDTFRTTGYKASVEEIRAYKRERIHAEEEELKKYQIILSTCNAAGSKRIKNFTNVRQCIIDEAGMCSEPETLIPLIATSPSQIVLLGDHKQLRPVITESSCKDLGMDVSLLEQYEDNALMLTEQYRMHESICQFPSKAFYKGSLETSEVVKKRRSNRNLLWPGGADFRNVFCHIQGKEETLTIKAEEGNEMSKANLKEVEEVMRILLRMVNSHKIKPHQILVLSQYRLQCAKLREEIAKHKVLKPVTVSTVITSQGGERDYVILSAVRSLPRNEIDEKPTLGWKHRNLGFIMDDNQMNVAITRAKEGLIIVGNQKLLQVHEQWRDLLSDYRHHSAIVNAGTFLRNRQQ